MDVHVLFQLTITQPNHSRWNLNKHFLEGEIYIDINIKTHNNILL